MNLYLLIGWGFLFFLFVVVMSILLYINVKKTIREYRKNERFKVKCSECGCEHDITIDALTTVSFTKMKYSSKKINGRKITNYKYYGKRMMCPGCDKKTYNEVLDYNSYKNSNLVIVLPIVGKYFIVLFIGGCIFIIIGSFIF